MQVPQPNYFDRAVGRIQAILLASGLPVEIANPLGQGLVSMFQEFAQAERLNYKAIEQAINADTGAGRILAYVVEDPASETEPTATTATFADADAALTIVFIAPASGGVKVTMSADAFVSGGAAEYLAWNLRSGSSNVAGSDQTITSGGDNWNRTIYTSILTGLTPGDTYTYKWGLALLNPTGGTGAMGYGGRHGPAIMEVTELV